MERNKSGTVTPGKNPWFPMGKPDTGTKLKWTWSQTAVQIFIFIPYTGTAMCLWLEKNFWKLVNIETAERSVITKASVIPAPESHREGQEKAVRT